MSINSDIRDQAYQFFIEEAPELLHVIELGLMDLREDCSTAKVHDLMRSAHSIKGGAASVGLDGIKTIAHRLEDIFKALYSDDVVIDNDLESALLAAFDHLRNPLMDQIETGSCDAATALTQAEPLFELIEASLGEAFTSAENFIPSSADLGIDMAQSLFEVDVQQGLSRLSQVLATPDDYEVAGEVRAQAEVFSGFSELLGLPGFGDIAQIMATAVASYPDRALDILRVALVDLQAGRTAVLSGDRTRGGEPSAALIALMQGNAAIATDNEAAPTAEADITASDTAALADIFGGGAAFDLDLAAEPAPAPPVIPTASAVPDLSPEALELRQQAYQYFSQEAPELLDAIDAGLATLRDRHDTTVIHEIARAAHSIKGGSASAGLETIRAIALRVEHIFKALHGPDVNFDLDLETALKQAAACLRQPLTAQFASGSFDEAKALADAEPILTQLEARLQEAMANADSFIPSSADLGIDMVQSLFEVDVAQGIAQLRTAVTDTPDNAAAVLKAQADMFSGLSEVLSLPGLGAIGQTALAALANHPERAREIAELALVDYEAAHAAVMAGDRERGGAPSETLMVLAEAALVVEAAPSEDVVTAEFDAAATALFGAETAPEALPSVEDIFAAPDLAASALIADVFGGAAIAPPESDATEPALEPTPIEPPAIVGEEFAAPTNLAEAVQSVADIFGSLPTATDLIASATPPPAAKEVSTEAAPLPSTGQSAAPKQARPTARMTVRVDLDRLERMDNQVGELSINRNGLSLQNEQIQAAVRELQNRFARFQSMANSLRDLSDQMVVAPERFGMGLRPLDTDSDDSTADFDALEMDRYGGLHSLVLELLEETVQLEEAVGDIGLYTSQVDKTLEQQRQGLGGLRDELMWARMLPLGEILNRFPRMLRDLSSKYRKPVELKLTGTSVLVDKSVLEKLYDPMMHLLRNAFDHGIERPSDRRQANKSEKGTIEVAAYYRGSQTIIEVRDDGRGVDIDRVRQKAIENGLVSAERAATLSREQMLDLMFEPGFSTAESVSELSGRGVGLDVVRSQLRALKGTVSLVSTLGRGTTFTMRLPLTLTISKLMVCVVESTAVAFPSDSIEEIIIPQPQQIKTMGERQFLHWRDDAVPLYPLSELLNFTCPAPDVPLSKALVSVPAPEEWAPPILVVRQERQVCALQVDRLVTEQELVIKPFGSAIKAPGYSFGCTILGDGSLVPVLDGIALANQRETGVRAGVGLALPVGASSADENEVQGSAPIGAAPVVQAPTILVVDDSITLRQTLALTFERAGYRVLQARDGREAVEQLERHSAIQLVVCDVEMPNMNGFEFLSHRRQNPSMADIPVVMLTSRSGDKHRKLAMHLGANDYFTKPYLEQEFLAKVDALRRKPVGTAALSTR
ncbi:MAG: response regulator [Cyanobacteria bacterium P01_D01_bin.123]